MNYQQLTETLAQLFKPWLQIALFDRAGQRLALHNQLTANAPQLPADIEAATQITTVDIPGLGKAKTVTLPLGSEQQAPAAYLHLVFDISHFDIFNQQLMQCLENTTQSQLEGSWQAQVNTLLDNYLTERQLTLNACKRQDKRNIINCLYQQGVFAYQEASKLIADKLNISRASVYNYLNEAKTLQNVSVHQVDAFTDKPFSGNAAGVVLDGENIPEDIMRKIAKQMNLSETSFVLPSEIADFKLRFFTRTGVEVVFCGHSTVGALFMLANEQRYQMHSAGHYSFQVETEVGILPMEIRIDRTGNISVSYEAPRVNLIDFPTCHDEIAAVLGIDNQAINHDYPVMFETVNKDLFFVVNDLKTLGRLNVDERSATAYAKQHDIVGYCAVSTETFAKHNHLHTRSFAPSVGIPEDPFTGSLQGGLTIYALQNKLLPQNIKVIGTEQGHFMDRPGEVQIEVHQQGKRLVVIAKARHFFSTEIQL